MRLRRVIDSACPRAVAQASAPAAERASGVLPNVLTMARLVLVPFILWFAYSGETATLAAALGLFLVAAFTDWLDGYLARTRNLVTPFGTLMDPVTDKILVLGALFVFADRDPPVLPLWLVLINLFRELLVSGIRQLKALRGKLVGANWMGKFKFVLQSVLVGGILLYLTLESAGVRVPGGQRLVFWAALAATAIAVVLAFNFFRWHSGGMLEREAEC